MKLLYLLPEYVTNSGGGIITFYRHFLPLLVTQGHEVRVIVGSGVTTSASSSPVVIDGVHVETLENILFEQYHARFTRYAAMPSLRRYLAAAWAMWEQSNRGEGYDLVEATDWGLLFLPWVIEEAPPTVVQLHGSMGQIDLHDPVRGEEAQGNLIRLIECLGIRRADSAQAYSRANAIFWERQTGRSVKSILPAWRPLIPFDPAVSKNSHGLVVGRVQRWKGPEVLCQALRLLNKKAPATEWMGRDTPFKNRDTMTSNYLCQNWPDIWGKVVTHRAQQPFEYTAKLQAEAAFMVVPSLWDTFNFTCVEAMGAGTVVICSTGAGASELIENGINGFVFENGNAESLAETLDRFLALNLNTRQTIAEAGRRTVLNKLAPENVCHQRVTAYQDILHTSSRESLPKDDFLRLACSPTNAAENTALDFLDHLPLKSLLGYSIRRSFHKLRR